LIISKFIDTHEEKKPNSHSRDSLTTSKININSDDALNYHKFPTPGKYTIKPTKSLVSQKDLSLAYSPGVAIPVLEISRNPDKI